MSLNLTFTGPPLPVTERGRPTKIYVHKDGDTVIYANKTAVIARSLSDPSKIPTVYTQHRAKVTVAKFSPNGNYVASGDESGKVRIWAYTHEEHLLKKEVSTVGRGVRDVDWDGEGKRVVACGDGDKKAIAFSWDSGSELGKMTGMSTPACGVAFKNERPYRIVVGCEDKKAYFFSGPPFKPAGIKREHKNMITSVAFSPDGSKFITVGSDKTGHFYDGKSGDPIGKLSNKKKDRHNGTIYAVDFSPDNASVLTASSDKTNKLWDAGSGALITTLVVGGPKAQIRDQQVGGVFSAHGPVSVSLSGEIHIFNPESPDAPARTLQGHQATPGALALDSNGNPATGCMDGILCTWVDGWARRVDGQFDPKNTTRLHKGAIQGVTYHAGKLVSAGLDGVLNTIDTATGEIAASEEVGSPIISIETAGAKSNISVLITASEELISFVDGKVASKLALPAEPAAVAIASDASFAVVALPRDRKLLFVDIGADGALTIAGDAVTLDGAPHAVAISPDLKTLVVSEGADVTLVDTSSREPLIQGYWQHNANVTTLDFSPDGETIVSGAKDSELKLWKPSDKRFKSSVLAHFQGVIRARFASNDTIFSVGVDNCLRTFKIGGAAEEEAAAE
mmetsp:Transcript_49214/g.73180  ORF Transcript_49214/g.73180 Transcript_49214/m.73180 type:complete len:622 (+) Transcript_49214:79-1944(+)|eukprot:CAMPEP_0195524738 /NCGR_PEP_ID=MMETSP0794_2-20130614/24753_1 /TAXON_ID=515487 /ORGANISM="Stephanopyxis turris, Strain CCMP 815" /LENGTH=621 /DNA_ID=CAMNT_0040655027 /DNA_START=79 /DNA_END=1944 /DNA_ORIENTATION=-